MKSAARDRVVGFLACTVVLGIAITLGVVTWAAFQAAPWIGFAMLGIDFSLATFFIFALVTQ